MKFSERLGLTSIRTELSKEELPLDLRNTLWSLVYEGILYRLSNDKGYNPNFNKPKEVYYSELASFYRSLWLNFFKIPLDELIISYGEIRSEDHYIYVRKWFFNAKWNEVYEFIEFCADYKVGDFEEACNFFLKKELAAYRFVNGLLVEINSKEEVLEIEKAINIADKFKPIKIHLLTSLKLLSDKKNPDYRNSIKESISSVESLCKIIIQDDTATLGQALKKIEQKHNIPSSLKSGFSALYGYTSDKSGIRHALINDEIIVGIDEARFMLVTCSAFVNYLISKI